MHGSHALRHRRFAVGVALRRDLAPSGVVDRRSADEQRDEIAARPRRAIERASRPAGLTLADVSAAAS